MIVDNGIATGTFTLLGNLVMTGSGNVNMTGSFTGSFSGAHTGSLFGTSSQSTSASYAYSASSAVNSFTAVSASYAANAATSPIAFNVQTADYVISSSDAGKIIRMNSATSRSITLPDNATGAILTGSFFTIEQTGAGPVTLFPGGSATILTTARTTWGQYKVIQAYKVDTNTWNVLGGIV
jgi:hypothetical protein